MKKFIIPLILLFVLSGCSIHKNFEQKSSGTSKHTTSEENKETVDKKGSDQATFEEQLGEMLEEIDNLDFENDDDGFPSELK